MATLFIFLFLFIIFFCKLTCVSEWKNKLPLQSRAGCGCRLSAARIAARAGRRSLQGAAACRTGAGSGLGFAAALRLSSGQIRQSLAFICWQAVGLATNPQTKAEEARSGPALLRVNAGRRSPQRKAFTLPFSSCCTAVEEQGRAEQ